MTLIIDVGNSRSKFVAFDGDVLFAAEAQDGNTLHGLRRFCEGRSFEAAIVSSVVDLSAAARAELDGLGCPVTELTPQTATPLGNAYRTPQTLGTDRLAAAVAAHVLAQGRPALVIDAGSCVTFDVVTADGVFVGGNIAPGLQARLRAIGDYFPRLPRVEADGDAPLLGYDTHTAIRSGALQGLAREAEGYIARLSRTYPGLIVFMTGGDDLPIEPAASVILVRDHHLAARGMNRILHYNLHRESQPQ